MNQRLQLPLSGIQRNKPDGISEDGTLQEMINMRPKDGAWRVVGRKTQHQTFLSGYRFHFLHKISPTRYAWFFTRNINEVGYYLYDADGNEIEDETSFDTITGTQSQISFTALGNLVIKIDEGAETLTAYLFEPDNDSYRLVGDLLPDLLEATITNTDAGDGADVRMVHADFKNDTILSRMQVEIADQRENGYWINQLYFRYAYELFDGSIVKHSPPIRIEGGTFENWTWDGVAHWETFFNKKNAIFQIFDTDLATIQSKYAGIIKSINIYACRPKEEVELTPPPGASGYVSGDSPVDVIHTNPILDEVDSFYLVKKINLDELTSSWVNIFDNDDISDLALRESMPVDNMTNHTLYSPDVFTYNQRLFWSKVKNTLFSGFSPTLSNPYGNAGTTDIVIYAVVTIETSQGQKVVVSPASETLNYISSTGHFACFAYPDTRASKVKFVVYDGAGSWDYSEELSLTPHKFFNFAFIEDAEWDDDDSTTLPTEVKTYWDYNRIQATEIMNALYFPAANSYRVGHGTMVGLSTNAIAISTGQFGEYPIFAFTTDGIWTLQIGTEEVLILSIKPLSRHVCDNSQSILPIDGGSTFATAKGLFIISGEKIIEISGLAEGEFLSQIASNSDYTSLLSDADTEDIMCDEGFLDYLDDAVIGYDFIENEILVSKSSREYSWVYQIDNGMWYKRDQVWNYFINNFPVMYGVSTGAHGIYDLTSENSVSSSIIHIETRPISFGITGLKKMLRTLIEAQLTPELSTSLFTVHLYGSADGVNYALIYGDELLLADLANQKVDRVLLGRSIYSCEYFILVINYNKACAGGQLRTITIDVGSKFSSKLRVDM